MTPFETVICAVWLSSFVWPVLMILGYFTTRHYSKQRIDKPPFVIFQITTIGNSTVNQLIDTILSYDLKNPFEIWVVTEPSDKLSYPRATKTIVVPKNFVCKAKYKSRALEYTRLLRINTQLPSGYRVIYMDDDSVPSREFVGDCLSRQFDILEGTIRSVNLKGKLMTYFDIVRTQSCMTICSFAQAISHPIWVHGEAMCVSENVDKNLSWDRDTTASEDLCYGHWATAKGFKMRFTYAPIYISAPLSMGDYITQRRRWFWGNMHAIRSVLPTTSKLKMGFMWGVGKFTFIVSLMGAALDTLHIISYPLWLTVILDAGLAIWFISWGAVGAILFKTGRSTLFTMFFSWFALAWTNLVFIYCFLFTRPIKKFDVIQKKV
jgi:Glycosyl transferase family group 2